jgi:peptidoglycan/LPS O-acetylase OafA/YrhL
VPAYGDNVSVRSIAISGGQPPHYIPAFDGLRAIAVGMVILIHAAPVQCQGGWVGVDIFFVLSGYLISSILLRERDNTGHISLSSFYARRALRLFPALFTMLGLYVVVALVAMPHVRMHLTAAAAAALYAMNWVLAFMPLDGAAVGHTWSLSIEEQFYAVYPLLLLGLTARVRSRVRLSLLLLSGALLVTFCRALLWTNGYSAARLYHGFDSRADSLLIGCALSVVLASGRYAPRLFAWASPAWPLAAAGLLAVLLTTKWSATWLYMGGFTAIAVMAAVVITQVVSPEPGHLQRLLALPPIVAIGKISYGIYLWHYPILRYVPTVLMSRLHIGHMLAICIAVAMSIIVAALSYRFIEAPFLRKKQALGRASA